MFSASIPERNDLIIGAALFLLSIIKLNWRIGLPAKIVWDELHFTRFSSWYINGHYFVDIHPPLAKLIMALVLKIVGFKSLGQTNIKWWGDKGLVGDDDYQELFKDGSYIHLRRASTVMGSLLVVATFAAVRCMGCGRVAAFLGAWLVWCDNFITLDSRLILTDVYLWFFGMATLACSFASTRRNLPLQDEILWVVATGFSLGCVVSVKYTSGGIFVFTGLHQLCHLIYSFYESSRRVRGRPPPAALATRCKLFWKTAVWKGGCILALAACIFFLCWVIHIKCLPYTGMGDSFMSFRYKLTLSTPGMDHEHEETEADAGKCPNHKHSWYDCGDVHTTRDMCIERGCCWDQTSPAAWCYPIEKPVIPPPPPLWEMVKEILVATWQNNKSDAQKYHAFMSRWWEWPFQTCRLNLFDNDTNWTWAIWGLGNTLSWWAVAITMILTASLLQVYSIAKTTLVAREFLEQYEQKPKVDELRHYIVGLEEEYKELSGGTLPGALVRPRSAMPVTEEELEKHRRSKESPYSMPTWILFLCLLVGYSCGLFPFYFIDRSTWNYHYMLALLCGVLTLALGADVFLRAAASIGQKPFYVALGVVVAFMIAVFWVWWYFVPWTYGLPLTREEHDARKWFPLWGTALAPPPTPTPRP